MINLYDFLKLFNSKFNIVYRTKYNDSFRRLTTDDKQLYSLCYVLSFWIEGNFLNGDPVLFIKLDY